MIHILVFIKELILTSIVISPLLFIISKIPRFEKEMNNLWKPVVILWLYAVFWWGT